MSQKHEGNLRGYTSHSRPRVVVRDDHGRFVHIPQPKNWEVLFRESQGEVLFQQGQIEILAPNTTDFPIESGWQVQVINRDSSFENFQLGETPLISAKADVRQMLQVVAFGIIAEQALVEQTDHNVWANLNLHSRPPMTIQTPDDAQYNVLTLDVHGRSLDKHNWTRPPATHGAWGAEPPEFFEEDIETAQDASEADMQAFGTDLTISAVANPANPKDFNNWEEHPTGMYFWDGGRRHYLSKELDQLRTMFQSSIFLDAVQNLQAISLFQDPNLPTQHFEANDNDIVLWEFGGYQLVTQRNPLVDRDKGIHMVLKLRPEPHTPWDNPVQTLEAYAIGLGIARLLRDTQNIGEIGDVYFDMNANWSMIAKGEKIRQQINDRQITIGQAKQLIQQDTRAHLHIQLERMTALWEIPPAPATFTENRAQTPDAIEEIRKILNDQAKGLNRWLLQNCQGRIFS